MARASSEAEALRVEVRVLRDQLARLRDSPPETPFTACGDLCAVATPRGVVPVGQCRCDERTLRRAVSYWRRRSEYLVATVDELRAECGRLRAERDEARAKEATP